MIKVIIPKTGPIRTVYSEKTAELIKALGKATTRRASHVEPGGGLSDVALSWLHNQYAIDNAGTKGQYTLWDPLRIREEFTEQWFADMTPVDGPVLGPFSFRETALRSELAWLYEHGIPTAK